MNRKYTSYYILFISLLLILNLWAWNKNDTVSVFIHFLVWLCFTLDFVIRFFKSKDKFIFFNKHIFDLLACIPFYNGFQFFKFPALLIYIVEDTHFGKRYILKTYSKIMDSKLGRITFSVILFLLIMPIPLVWIEPHMHHYADVLWWVIQTATTVGYGDIVPVTFIGRVIGTLLMVIGVGLIGFISSMLTRFLINTEETTLTDILQKTEDLSLQELKKLEQWFQQEKKRLLKQLHPIKRLLVPTHYKAHHALTKHKNHLKTPKKPLHQIWLSQLFHPHQSPFYEQKKQNKLNQSRSKPKKDTST